MGETHRVLSEDEVRGIAQGRETRIIRGSGRVYSPHTVRKLCASHQLLQKRVKELEAVVRKELIIALDELQQEIGRG